MFKFFFPFLITLIFFIPKVSFAHSQVQIIEMTANGFVPKETTIDENSTVIFINKDSAAHWPASDIHPTHEIYPEFDPKKGIEPNQSWTFKFTRVGEWSLHDHLFPHFRGKITVLKEPGNNKISSSAPTLLDMIKDLFKRIMDRFRVKKTVDISNLSNLSQDAQIKEVKEMADQEGVEKVWQKIKEVFKGQSGTSGNIHDLAHLAGNLLYIQKGFDGLKLCSADFAFGCYHGFLDEAFRKNLDHILDAQEACLKLGQAGSGPVASCIHGIGHGIASFYSTSDIKKALSSCRKLTSGAEYCYDGVFMEFVRSAPPSFFKQEDTLYPCDSLEKEFGYTYSFACGRNQPFLLMSRFSLGFDEVVNICLNSNSSPFKQACFDSLGFSLASSQDTDKITSSCKNIKEEEFIKRCIQAAAGELVFQEVPGWYEKSQAVCKATSAKDECLQNVDRIIKEYDKQVKTIFAPKAESEDINTYLRNQLKICFSSDGRDGCYKQVAKVFYDQFGLSQTLHALKDNEDYPEVYARCHEVTHYLSRFEYEKQKDIGKVYALCDSTCHGGCYHGTMEAYLKEQTIKANFDLNSSFSKICGKLEDYKKPLEYNECLHGLGHAAMFVTDMELKQSLKDCDLLDLEEHKERCYTGVFMENSSSSTSFDHASIYIKKDDPFYPCNSLAENYQAVCWQYQSSYFSIINNQDWVKVSDMCLQIPQKYQDKCFRTIGTNQVGFTKSLQTMKQDCDLMPDDNFKDICVSGVVSSLSYRFVGEAQRMVEFCSQVNDQNKETCFKQMGKGLLDWDKNKDIAKKECSKISDLAGSSWCLSVI